MSARTPPGAEWAEGWVAQVAEKPASGQGKRPQVARPGKARRVAPKPRRRPWVSDPVTAAYVGAMVGAVVTAAGVSLGMWVTGPMLHSRPAPTVTVTASPTATVTLSPQPLPSRLASARPTPSPSPSRR